MWKKHVKICAAAQAPPPRFRKNLFCFVFKFLFAKVGPKKVWENLALALSNNLHNMWFQKKKKTINLRGRSSVRAQMWRQLVLSCLRGLWIKRHAHMRTHARGHARARKATQICTRARTRADACKRTAHTQFQSQGFVTLRFWNQLSLRRLLDSRFA